VDWQEPLLHVKYSFMEKKYKASIIILTVLSFVTLTILLNILMGKIGNNETWRITFASLGFIGISFFSVLLIRLNLRKIRESK
jgi:hypothetical protein